MTKCGLFRVIASCLVWLVLSAVRAPETGAQLIKFQELLAAAKKEAAEGTFTVWASNPRDEKTRQALFDTFRKKYRLEALKFEWLPLHPRDTATRIVAETRASC